MMGWVDEIVTLPNQKTVELLAMTDLIGIFHFLPVAAKQHKD
jgi:hypothetical protein